MKYQVYNFCLISNMTLPIPELTNECSQGQEVTFILNSAMKRRDKEPLGRASFIGGRDWNGEPFISAYKTAKSSYLLRFHDIADYYIDMDSKQIMCLYLPP